MGFIVKNTTFSGPLDLLAPHSCRGCGRIGTPFCECCKNNILANRKNFCPNCKHENPTGNCQICDLPKTFLVGERNGILGSLIHDFKYNSVRALARPLAELLAASLPDFKNQEIIIVPLPTASHHIRSRAFDHTLLLAKHLARLKGWQVKKLLLRAKNTVQVGTDQKTRQAQAKSAYKINPKLNPDQTKTYLILDDVWTTGSSLKAAIEIIKTQTTLTNKNLLVAILAVNSLN